MSAMKVFSESIRYLKEHMISECNGEHNITDSQKLRHHDNGEKNLPEVQEGDIFWVLTVPAIWDDTAKQFMREAAINVSKCRLNTKQYSLGGNVHGILLLNEPMFTMK